MAMIASITFGRIEGLWLLVSNKYLWLHGDKRLRVPDWNRSRSEERESFVLMNEQAKWYCATLFFPTWWSRHVWNVIIWSYGASQTYDIALPTPSLCKRENQRERSSFVYEMEGALICDVYIYEKESKNNVNKKQE